SRGRVLCDDAEEVDHHIDLGATDIDIDGAWRAAQTNIEAGGNRLSIAVRQRAGGRGARATWNQCDKARPTSSRDDRHLADRADGIGGDLHTHPIDSSDL